ncbi:MAG: carboxypeptidase-like regulatory domain-containing protein [Planctomycetota bacterium]|nr:carboxypeptidase-like regulatory domain-containing protein [Planctomycetota bacterium]
MIALAALAAIVVAGLFLFYGLPEEKTATVPTPSEPEAEPKTTEPAELEDARPPGHAPQAGLAAVAHTPKFRARVAVDATDRIWGGWADREAGRIEGRLVQPAGAPEDETLFVLALREDHDAAGIYGRHGALYQLELGEHEPESVLATHPVAADGTFWLPYPEDVQEIWVAVSGRYLYSRGCVRALVGSDEPIVLEPAVGAWITGTLRVPQGAADHPALLTGVEIDLEYDPRQFSMFDLGQGWMFSRSTGLDEDLRFEFRGVMTNPPYRVEVESDDLANWARTGIQLTEGREYELTVDLVEGGTVRGVVRDDAGQPIVGARVRASSQTFMGMAVNNVRTDTTDAAGAFELVHVTPGSLRVGASYAGYLDAKSVKVELADRQTVADVLVELGLGNLVSGFVRYEDGTPAEGAEIDVSFDPAAIMTPAAFNASRGADGEAEADETGWFEVTGLGNGPFVVRAEAGGAFGEELSGSLTTRRDGVRPNGAELELVLKPRPVVRGVVRNQEGEPVTSFRISATLDGMSPWGGMGSEERDFESEDGTFELDELYVGSWKLMASAQGYGDSPGIPVALPELEGAPPLEFVLPTPAVAAGVVLSPAGEPLAGATVSLELNLSSILSRATGEFDVPEARSGATGEFELSGLTPGSVSLVASHPDYAESEPFSFDVKSGQRVEDVVLKLREGGILTGEVYGEDGKPAGGMTVILQKPPPSFAPILVQTGPDGTFRREGMSPGNWMVVVMMGGFDPEALNADGESDVGNFMQNMRFESANIKEGELTHVVLGAPPTDPVQVSGTVTHAGEPVSNATVTFFPSGAEGFSAMKFTQLDSEGRYKVLLGQSGDYNIQIQTFGTTQFEQNNLEFAERIPEDVDEHELDLELPTGRISGMVRSHDGKPLARARVSLTVEGGLAYGTWMGGHYVEWITKDDGTYDITFIRPGVYSVAAGGAFLGGAFGGETENGRTLKGGIRLEDGQWIQDLDFRLKRSGELTGTVVDLAGQPVSGAAIFVRDEAGRLLERFTMLVTDSAGRFSYKGVAPGNYTVSARTGEMASFESNVVGIPEGGKASTTLTLDAGTVVQVSVIDKTGNQVKASISVRDQDGREVNGMIGWQELMEAKGHLYTTEYQQVGPLPPGRYVVTVMSEDGRVVTKPVTLSGQPERKLKIRLK